MPGGVEVAREVLATLVHRGCGQTAGGPVGFVRMLVVAGILVHHEGLVGLVSLATRLRILELIQSLVDLNVPAGSLIRCKPIAVACAIAQAVGHLPSIAGRVLRRASAASLHPPDGIALADVQVGAVSLRIGPVHNSGASLHLDRSGRLVESRQNVCGGDGGVFVLVRIPLTCLVRLARHRDVPFRLGVVHRDQVELLLNYHWVLQALNP